MDPISEADHEIRTKVVAITGECSCRNFYLKLAADHSGRSLPPRDPSCLYHQTGEHFANLLRENRRLRRSLEQINHRRRKAT